MRAARYHEYGDPDVLRVEDAPEPHAPAGAIRIRTVAASVNPIDWKLRAGFAKEALPLEFPVIPGRDAAGVVDEVGEGVTGVAAGDLVFGLGGVSDTTAEFSVLTSWAKKPGNWDHGQAAAAGLAATTGIRGLAPHGDLAGKTLLIEGAAGAVGSAAAVVALSRGARVIGTASERNQGFLRDLGVIPTTYGSGLTERVSALAPGGVDAVLDSAGSGSLAELVAIAGDPGRVTTVADARRAGDLGVQAVDAANESAVLEVAAQLGAAGKYTPRIAQTLPLASIAEAHALAQQSQPGKIVVVLDQA
ncbi:NADP-dependent oxidoreductase [Amycolatopsis jejuensis]|uniref:NADP-dependent oxidoreductase n=1 Tax=Amycolatopsis jejuensis TaxID=330084 RepID=UPI000525F755|nr:NADP-dependent oxidoreductase [Amycolatopsis jejuensis]